MGPNVSRFWRQEKLAAVDGGVHAAAAACVLGECVAASREARESGVRGGNGVLPRSDAYSVWVECMGIKRCRPLVALGCGKLAGRCVFRPSMSILDARYP